MVGNHHNVARAHVDDRNVGLFFGMFQDHAFMPEIACPVIVADPPDLPGFFVIRVCEFIGEADGVPGGSAIVVFHGFLVLLGCGFLLNGLEPEGMGVKGGGCARTRLPDASGKTESILRRRLGAGVRDPFR